MRSNSIFIPQPNPEPGSSLVELRNADFSPLPPLQTLDLLQPSLTGDEPPASPLPFPALKRLPIPFAESFPLLMSVGDWADEINRWSYTRGKDLSGSFDGAGGIGGLLAFSQVSTIIAQHSYYHADGNGNVTVLINSTQFVVAKYIYDPFGSTLSSSGVLADLNSYRFSSKETHLPSGFVYYLFRYFDPAIQRWLNRDPIADQGGGNLYCMVGNNPLTRIDPQGLSELGDVIPGWWDAGWNTFDWVLGHSGITDYGPESLQSRQMSHSSIAGQLRDYFLKKNKGRLCKDRTRVSNFQTHFRVFHEVIFDVFNGTAEFVGDARGDVIAKKDLVNCKIKAEFHFMNTTSLRSLLYGRWPDKWNVTLPGFPLANWTQFYVWTETFDCKCCR